MTRYLLWERHGAMLRLAQWDWLRMKVKHNLTTKAMLVVWISALFMGSSPAAEFGPVFLFYINTFNFCSAPLFSTSPP